MEEKNVPDWLIPNRVYDVLKWVGLIACPALAVFVQAVGPAWGFADTSAVVLTLNAFGALIGVLIGASALKGAAND
ncbi:phage holin [Slackia isoflavoniconvertens]|uniref:Holin n=1 Tax=Slackia isoflavoniconvertens TaxID=572010 RepID=A0A3N0I958_9ACTN|nr:phage holin [Slackia isoflavoniconvertens]MBB3279781.1 hypothetical protein [Slackia isoflavoniconvertens]RNM33529.1 holin [Slackia isoflavoniconvertens]